MQVKIIKLGINGEGIGYIERKPIFIQGALIDELVEVKNVELKNTYYTGELSRVLNSSTHRVKPKCQIYDLCGGCSLMHLMVKHQLNAKVANLRESLIKYTGRKDYKIMSIVPSEDYYYYRNQFKFPVKTINGKLVSGLYEEETKHLVHIEHCIIHDKGLEKRRVQIMEVLNKHQTKDYYSKIESGLRMIILRGFNGQFQLTLVTGKNSIYDACLDDLMKIEGIKSVYQNVNTDETKITSDEYRLLRGNRTIELKHNDLVFRLAPAAFFQLNLKQAMNLYEHVVSLIEPCDFVVEAYSGIGVMSLLASSKAKRIEGVEISRDAVKNANSNAKFNHVSDKVSFVCEDAGEYMRKLNTNIDYLLVDPPRRGLDQTMINAILKYLPKTIIYVSCNPSTLAKNINELKDSYEVDHIKPFDMFTHTAHVECVVVMKRNINDETYDLK